MIQVIVQNIKSLYESKGNEDEVEINNNENLKQYIGQNIVKKIQTQFNNKHSSFAPWEILHVTKLEYKLESGITLIMRIGEVYSDINLYESNTYVQLNHSGGDGYL